MRRVRVFGQIFVTGYITNVLITVIKNNIENKFSLVCEVLWNVTSADSKKLLLIWESLLIHGDSKIIFFSTGCVCGVFNLENVFEFVRRRCEFRHDQVVTVGCSFFKITFDQAQRTIIFLVIFYQSLTLIFIKNCSSLFVYRKKDKTNSQRSWRDESYEGYTLPCLFFTDGTEHQTHEFFSFYFFWVRLLDGVLYLYCMGMHFFKERCPL